MKHQVSSEQNPAVNQYPLVLSALVPWEIHHLDSFRDDCPINSMGFPFICHDIKPPFRGDFPASHPCFFKKPGLSGGSEVDPTRNPILNQPGTNQEPVFEGMKSHESAVKIQFFSL